MPSSILMDGQLTTKGPLPSTVHKDMKGAQTPVKKFLVALLAVLTMLTGTVAATPSASAQTSSSNAVHQGDKLWNIGGDCTVGYVDKAKREVWVSAHCWTVGSDVYKGFTRIGKVDRAGEDWKNLQENADNVSIQEVRGDWAVIKLGSGVTPGTNKYSGNAIARWALPGDQVCTYGQKTAKVSCGKVTYVGNGYIESAGLTTQPGDSGGPVYLANGGGIVALHSGPTSNDLDIKRSTRVSGIR